KDRNESRIASSLNNLASIELRRDDGVRALPYLLEAKDIKEKYQDSASLVTVYTNIGTAYYLQKKWNEAREFYEKSQAMASQIGYTEGALTNLPAMIRLDTLQGNYRQAFSAFTEYHRLSGEYMSEAKQKELLELDKKYETEKRQLEILFKDEQLQARDRFLVVVLLVTAGIFLLLVYVFVLFRKNKRLSLRNEMLVKEQNHRVKNNLQMINSLLS